jgi:hypothetical protein
VGQRGLQRLGLGGGAGRALGEQLLDLLNGGQRLGGVVEDALRSGAVLVAERQRAEGLGGDGVIAHAGERATRFLQGLADGAALALREGASDEVEHGAGATQTLAGRVHRGGGTVVDGADRVLRDLDRASELAEERLTELGRIVEHGDPGSERPELVGLGVGKRLGFHITGRRRHCNGTIHCHFRITEPPSRILCLLPKLSQKAGVSCAQHGPAHSVQAPRGPVPRPVRRVVQDQEGADRVRG